VSDFNKSGADFNAHEHIASLCGRRVKLSEVGNFCYRGGWRGIIADFMFEIRTFNVVLETVHEDMGQLEIRFTCYQKSNENKVWLARYKAINNSKRTCVLCGAHGSRLVVRREVTTLCRSNECMLAHCDSSMRTGTWLDEF